MLVSVGAGAAALIALRGTAGAQATPEASAVATRTVTDRRGDVVIPADPRRFVALGDEFLLADLLALGVQPIASSASYADGYIGIDPAATADFVLPPFDLFNMDMEQILGIGPDLILVPDYVYEMNPETTDAVGQIVPLVVVETMQDDWRAYIGELAAIFGKESQADARLAELDTSIENAKGELSLDGQTVSVVTIYPGAQSVTAWVGTTFMPVELLEQLGAEIQPTAADFEVDDAGRAEISLEQVNVIDGEHLIMLQTAGAADEQQRVDEITASPLWQGLPAVQNDQVYVLERIGYPGELSGRLTLLEAYRELFGS
jgi:iron complex transport system substrate-binding protein